jgi:hypothetical protein
VPANFRRKFYIPIALGGATSETGFIDTTIIWISIFLSVSFDYPLPFWDTYGARRKDFGEEIRRLIYKGDSFVISILESIRFQFDPPYTELNKINAQLSNLIQKPRSSYELTGE